MKFMRQLALAVAILCGLAACAASGGSRSTGQVIDDASITTRVKTALAKDVGLGGAYDVSVTTYQGTVQLSGFVNSRELADRAGQIARSVEGVRSVKNDVQVVAGQPSNSSAGSSSRPNSSSTEPHR